MIKIENTEVIGWEAAIRGMRNPMNSWDKSDSYDVYKPEYMSKHAPFNYHIGPNDLKLMHDLRTSGHSSYRKFMRMIIAYVDITAPLYWWKEFDTYKVGTVANSCSTMHKITSKEFTIDDFSHDHLLDDRGIYTDSKVGGKVFGATQDFDTSSLGILNITIDGLNYYREAYLQCKEQLREAKTPEERRVLQTLQKTYWWQMIQLLPSSYNQRRTIMLSYEVLANIWESRNTHKLDEWCEHDNFDGDGFAVEKKYFGLCDWICSLPYSELITGENTLYDEKGTEASSSSTEN